MSYDSFDGGTHSKHDWVPVGWFTSAHFEGGGPIPGSTVGAYQIGDRVDIAYVVRACRHCEAVWYQEVNESSAADRMGRAEEPDLEARCATCSHIYAMHASDDPADPGCEIAGCDCPKFRDVADRMGRT